MQQLRNVYVSEKVRTRLHQSLFGRPNMPLNPPKCAFLSAMASRNGGFSSMGSNSLILMQHRTDAGFIRKKILETRGFLR